MTENYHKNDKYISREPESMTPDQKNAALDQMLTIMTWTLMQGLQALKSSNIERIKALNDAIRTRILCLDTFDDFLENVKELAESSDMTKDAKIMTFKDMPDKAVITYDNSDYMLCLTYIKSENGPTTLYPRLPYVTFDFWPTNTMKKTQTDEKNTSDTVKTCDTNKSEPENMTGSCITSTTIEGIKISVTEKDEQLVIHFANENSELSETVINKCHRSEQLKPGDYEISDIGSGTADDGTKYLAFAISETDYESALPYGIELEVCIIGSKVLTDYTHWNNDEYGRYRIYSKTAQKFVFYDEIH